MTKQKYVYRQDDDMWLGYLEAYPDYWTQGQTEEELREELSSGNIAYVHRVAELEVA